MTPTMHLQTVYDCMYVEWGGEGNGGGGRMYSHLFVTLTVYMCVCM